MKSDRPLQIPRSMWSRQLRSVLHLLVIFATLLLLVCSSIVLQYFHLLGTGFLFDLVDVKVSGLSESDLSQVTCTWCDNGGNEMLGAGAHRINGEPTWKMRTFFVGKLHIDITKEALAKLKSITVVLGDERFLFNGSQPLSKWTPCRPLRAADGKSRFAFEIGFPGYSFASLAEPGCMLRLIGQAPLDYVLLPAVLILSLVSFKILSGKPWFDRLERMMLTGGIRHKQKPHMIWFFIGFFIVALGLCALESMVSYYFVDDDNLMQFMPIINWAADSLVHGKLATFNPHQLLGAPTASFGVYALTYPPTYLSFVLAKYVFANQNLTLEIFAALHLLTGYALMFAVLRQIKVRPSLSALGAASFALSGFMLIAGRSWYYMLPVAVWVPALILSMQTLLQRPVGMRWALLTGLAIGLFFHAGNAQMWFYALLFCCLTLGLAVAIGRIHIKRAAWSIPALLIGIGLAAPLLLIQATETEFVKRIAAPTPYSGIFWANMFLPVGEFIGNLYWVYNRYIFKNYPPKEMCFFGTVFAAIAVTAVALVILRFVFYKGSAQLYAKICRENIWLPAMLLAMVLTAGSGGILWEVLAPLPIFNKLRASIRCLIFVVVFAIIAGSLILERLLSGTRAGRKAELAIIVPSWILLAVHLTQCNYAIGGLEGVKPFPSLDKAMEGMRTDSNPGLWQRYLPVNLQNSHALYRNYSTVQRVLSSDGYDLLVSETPENTAAAKLIDENFVAAARAFGVQWIVTQRPEYLSDPTHWPVECTEESKLNKFLQLAGKEKSILQPADGRVYQLLGAQPLAFASAEPAKPLPVRLQTDGVSVDVTQADRGSIVVNFLFRPWFVASLDGKVMAISHDNFGRITVELPNAGKSLQVLYRPPWQRGINIGLALMLVGVIIAAAMQRWMSERARTV